jgi:hypothetical protein
VPEVRKVAACNGHREPGTYNHLEPQLEGSVACPCDDAVANGRPSPGAAPVT